MDTIAGLEQQINDMRRRLAELEAADGDAIQAGQTLRAEWRAASLAADLDDDPAAAELANELQRRMQNVQLSDERRRFAIAEAQNRLRSLEGKLLAAELDRPMKFYRRRPGVPVPVLTRWARQLPGQLGADSDWQEISRDRLNYELSRAFGSDAAAVYRSIVADPGHIARSWDFELRAELVTE